MIVDIEELWTIFRNISFDLSYFCYGLNNTNMGMKTFRSFHTKNKLCQKILFQILTKEKTLSFILCQVSGKSLILSLVLFWFSGNSEPLPLVTKESLVKGPTLVRAYSHCQSIIKSVCDVFVIADPDIVNLVKQASIKTVDRVPKCSANISPAQICGFGRIFPVNIESQSVTESEHCSSRACQCSIRSLVALIVVL